MQSFNDGEFEKYRHLIYDSCGIYFSTVKKDILRNKVSKLMSKNNIASYAEYYDILATDGGKKYTAEFIDEITTNKTDFFRENNHFDFIKDRIHFIMEKSRRIAVNKEIRVWSAGCSTGEEAYTLAMVLAECLPEEFNIKILATDISNKVLSAASKGIYPQRIRDAVGPYHLNKYFERLDSEYFRVADNIRKMVTVRRFNLMELFPFENTFDILFCRNVMIYFDQKVQQLLLNKFYDVTAPGGLLFLGHSESLINKTHRYQYIQPTIYIK